MPVGPIDVGHRAVYFGGSDAAYLTPVSTHFASSLSVFTPSGSMSIHPFIGRPPERSKMRVCFSDKALSVSSGASLTIISDLWTPHDMLPFSMKASPPNIFFSVRPFFFPNCVRMRDARFSSKAIVTSHAEDQLGARYNQNQG